MTARILLVEDDPALLAVLKAALAHGGFASETAATGELALAAISGGGHDAVLLDLGLPDCEGGELLARLRSFSDVPVIVVSGRGTERDKIEALDLGADDFVAKPFLPGELLARVRAALRRYGAGGAAGDARPCERQPTHVGALTLDPFDNSVALHGLKVQLNPSEYRVLAALAAGAGELVSRGDLLAALYRDEDSAPEESKVIDVYISRIRSKLRTFPEGDDLIRNVRGRGWRFRPPPD